jgi:hypothetical protein
MSKVLIDSRHSSDEHDLLPKNGGETVDAPWLALVADKVKSLHYGVVQIVVHDSRVVQVERTERHRFDVQRGA